MAEKSEIDKGKILNNAVISKKGFDKEKAIENVANEENTFEPSEKNVDLNGSRDEDANLTWALSLGNDAVLGDDVWVNNDKEVNSEVHNELNISNSSVDECRDDESNNLNQEDKSKECIQEKRKINNVKADCNMEDGEIKVDLVEKRLTRSSAEREEQLRLNMNLKENEKNRSLLSPVSSDDDIHSELIYCASSFTSLDCPFKTKKAKELINHMIEERGTRERLRREKKEDIPCPACSYRFMNWKQLEDHVRDIHTREDKISRNPSTIKEERKSKDRERKSRDRERKSRDKEKSDDFLRNPRDLDEDDKIQRMLKDSNEEDESFRVNQSSLMREQHVMSSDQFYKIEDRKNMENRKRHVTSDDQHYKNEDRKKIELRDQHMMSDEQYYTNEERRGMEARRRSRCDQPMKVIGSHQPRRPNWGQSTLENKYEDSDHNVDIIYSTEDDNCIDTSDELTNAIDSMLIDPLNMDCEASNKNDRTADMSEDTKKDGPTITKTNQPVKFARIVFDATDMNKGCNTMRLKAATPMREIKKLFPKHLSATEDTFMLHFNNREVENETPLQLFGDNLEGDHNVIKIVKSIKICLKGQPFLQGKGSYLDKRPSTQFSVIRLNIATYLKEPQALIGLVYNGNEILNDQTPESVKMEHGDSLEVIKKDKMKLRFSGSIFETFEESLYTDIDPNIATMRKIKSRISRHVKLDQRKIMLIYKGQEPSDGDTPVGIGMYDTDIIFANLMFGIKIKGPMAAIEEFYPAEKPLIGLFQTYTEMHRTKSFVFRLNGDIVDHEDTAKSLNMVDGDCITACEKLTIVFKGTVFRERFEKLYIDTQRKFKDVREYFSDHIGVDFKDLVFSIGEERVVGDDDTLESLNISNAVTFISVSVKQYIQVNVLCFHLGQESLSLTSKMRHGMALEEWKSEISAQLGEPLHYLSFVWEDSDIADLDTPERIGIRNGDTVTVHSSNVIEIHIERDGEVLRDYFIHVDKDFFALTMWYCREFHACLNSFGFKFGEREVDIISDTPSKIGLLKDGTIQVFHQKQDNVITVEFYVENSSLLPIFPRLKEFPLLLDVSTVDQVILLKCLILEVFVRVIGEIDPSWIIFLHNANEINDAKTFQEIGISKGDKIGIDVREHKHDEKELTVYVTRNMKETKSSMGKGGQLGDEETCAFKLDTSKPLSEFIKKVKSRITCNSKKEKLFLSFNDAMVNKDLFLTFNDVMVNKDDFANNLKLVPSGNNHFKCYTFPDLEAFKKHLETSRNEKMSFMGSFSDSDYSFSSEDSDFPTWMPKYKRSNENSSEHRYNNYEQNQEESLSNEDFDFPGTPPNYKHKHADEQNSDEMKRDIEKKLKVLQMRINIDKKKKEKIGGISFAKDIQNHKDFENVDDILKFIGEDDLTSNTSKENKDQVGASKRRKGKNKKRIETPTTNKESDELKMQDYRRDNLVVEVSRGQDDVRDNKQNEIQDVLKEDKKDSRNKQSKNGKIKTDLDGDGDGCKNIENSNNLENLNEDSDEDSTVKTMEGNKRSLQRKKQNKSRKETNSKESDKKVKTVTDSTMDEVQRSKGNFIGDEHCEMKDVRKKGKKQRKNNKFNKSKDKTNLCSFVCNICTFINHRDAIFCDVCGNGLSIEEQNWQKVGIENKRKLDTKTQSKEKSNILKSKATTFSHPEKLLQKSEPKITQFPYHEKLLQESDLKTKETYIEEHVSVSILPKQQSTFHRENQKQSKDTGDAVNTECKQVEAKTEIFLENKKATEFPKLKKTCFINRFTSKGNQSGKDVNNTKKWTASEMFDFRNKINEENKSIEPEDEGFPVLTENEEETRKWCQLMVAARKKRDEERKRDYIKFLDMQSRNISPAPDGSNAQMFCDEVPSGTKPVVPQPKGMGNTQGVSIPREGRPQDRHNFGPSFEANNRPAHVFFPR